MSSRDHERRREGDERPPIITTPTNGNGKKWWRETWGKAVGSVLGALLLGAMYWAGGKALAFRDATVTVYALPPRVDRLEAQARAQVDAKRMTPTETQALAQEIVAAMSKQKGKSN